MERKGFGPGMRSAEESVDSKGEGSQWTDLSGPQSVTDREASEEQERRARVLVERFGRLNAVRAVLMGVGGVVGLWAAVL